MPRARSTNRSAGSGTCPASTARSLSGRARSAASAATSSPLLVAAPGRGGLLQHALHELHELAAQLGERELLGAHARNQHDVERLREMLPLETERLAQQPLQLVAAHGAA